MNIAKFGIQIDVAQARAAIHQLVVELGQLPVAANNSSTAFQKLAKSAALIIAPLAAAWAALKAFTGGLGLLQDAINSAAQMEKFRNSWAFFLGSFDLARAKMAELNAYAKASPFDIPGVNQAALTLVKLKNTGMDTMKGLEMVGNAAAVAGQPIETVALKISKLLNNLSRGGGAGDEATDLGEMQVFSAKLIGNLQEMGTEAGNFQKLLKMIKDELVLTAGGTQLMENSWEGMMSTLAASWDEFKTALGEPLIIALKPFIDDLSKSVDSVTKIIQGWAPQIQEAVTNIPIAFRALKSEGGFQLALTAGWDALVQIMNQTWKATEKTMISIFQRAGWELLNLLNKMNQPSFWDGLVNSLAGALSRAIDLWYNNVIKPIIEKMDTIAAKAGSAGKAVSAEIPGFYATLIKAAGAAASITGAASAGISGSSPKILGVDIQDPTGDRPPDALNQTITPEEDLSSTKPRPEETLLFPDIGPQPAVEPFVIEQEKPTEAMGLWAKLWDMTKKSVNDQISAVGTSNEELVQRKKREREEAALKADAAAALEPESEKEKKKRMQEMIPGLDMTLKQGEDYAKGMLEKALTPEEAYQAELKKIATISEALKLGKEDQLKMEQHVTDEYVEAQKKREEASKRAALQEMNSLQKLMYEWGNLKKNVVDASTAIMQAISDNITEAIVSMVDGTKSASEAFADMAQGIVKSILQIVTRLIVQYALMAAMGMATGISVPNFTAFSSKALSAGVMHEGGTVGEGGRSRSVSAEVFAGAQRFHSGGAVGLGPNEVPIIAERGETVMTADQAADIKSRLSGEQDKEKSKATVTIVNVANFQELGPYLMADPSIVMNVISSRRTEVREIVAG